MKNIREYFKSIRFSLGYSFRFIPVESFLTVILVIITPKGSDISKWSDEEIQNIEAWMNSLPRKVLGYATPQEVMVDNKQLVKSFIQINRY